MLRRRHNPKKETAGETKRRKETDESDRESEYSAGSIHRSAKDQLMFTPKYIEEGRALAKAARKVINYRKDVAQA